MLAGSRGISPEAKPSTQKRPPVPSARSADSAAAPPTGSMTMSAPPSVAARIASFRSV
jgi:hypothetical protein